MSGRSIRSFSPFLKKKSLILISCMRLSLGFPLTPADKTYDSFEFKPVYELIRLFIYLGILAGTGVINFVVLYNVSENKTNPLFMFNERLKNFGFTGLDIAVLSSMPCLNIASNIFYLISFKTVVKRLNKISLLLSSLNNDLYRLLGNDLFDDLEVRARPRGFKHYLPQIHASLIPVTAATLMTISFSIIAFEDDFTEFSSAQKILYSGALGIFSLCWIYPPVAVSADFLVCFLLNSAKEICEKYQAAILLTESPNGSYSQTQKSKIKNIFRYVLYMDRMQ